MAGLSHFSPQSIQNETATQTAESAMQSSNCIAMTATHFLKQKFNLVPAPHSDTQMSALLVSGIAHESCQLVCSGSTD